MSGIHVIDTLFDHVGFTPAESREELLSVDTVAPDTEGAKL